MPRPKKPTLDEKVMRGWGGELDAAVLERFKVEAKTSLDIFSGSMVTTWPADLDVQSALLIRIFIEGWISGMDNARKKLTP